VTAQTATGRNAGLLPGGPARLERVARRAIPPLAFFVIVITAWEAGVFHSLFNVQAFNLARPSAIVEALVDQREAIVAQAGVTLFEAFVGYIIGSAIGFGIAVASVWVEPARSFLLPLANGITAMPVIALAPLMILYFGSDKPSKVAVVVIMTMAPMAVTAFKGMNSVNPMSLELMDSYAASRFETFRRLRLPASLPFVFQALKLNVTLSLIGAIIAEFFSSQGGLGFYMTFALDRFDAATAWAIMIVAGAAGVILYLLVTVIERFAVPWDPSIRAPRR
jgi:NitT/TauT family transport system permease protein